MCTLLAPVGAPHVVLDKHTTNQPFLGLNPGAPIGVDFPKWEVKNAMEAILTGDMLESSDSVCQEIYVMTEGENQVSILLCAQAGEGS